MSAEQKTVNDNNILQTKKALNAVYSTESSAIAPTLVHLQSNAIIESDKE